MTTETRLNDNATVTMTTNESAVLVLNGKSIRSRDRLSDSTNMIGSDYVEAYYRIGDELPPAVRAFLSSNPTPSMHAIALLGQ